MFLSLFWGELQLLYLFFALVWHVFFCFFFGMLSNIHKMKLLNFRASVNWAMGPWGLTIMTPFASGEAKLHAHSCAANQMFITSQLGLLPDLTQQGDI